MSRDDADAEPLGGHLDKSGFVRVRKGAGETKPPSSGRRWHCLALEVPKQAVFKDMSPNLFDKYSDYLLGEHVMGLEAKNAKGEVMAEPSLSLVLAYDYQVRKKMGRQKGLDLGEDHVGLDPVVQEELRKEEERIRMKERVEESFILPPRTEEPSATLGTTETSVADSIAGGCIAARFALAIIRPTVVERGKVLPETRLGGITRIEEVKAWRIGRERWRAQRIGYPLGKKKVWGKTLGRRQATRVLRRDVTCDPLPQVKSTGFTIRLLYLFAGAEGQTSVVSYLRALLKTKGWQLEALEIDIKRSESSDLTRHRLQDEIIEDISKGKHRVAICTPPCSTWSRVRMANRRGPLPLRSKDHPWGFTWVKQRFKIEVELGYELVRFSIRVWGVVIKHIPSPTMVSRCSCLGSIQKIWALYVARRTGYVCIPPAFGNWRQWNQRSCWPLQLTWPVGVATSGQPLRSMAATQYTGPIDKMCSTTLVRQQQDDSFRTTGTDVYPPKLGEGIAQAIIQRVQDELCPSSKDGEDQKGRREEESTPEEATLEGGEEGKKGDRGRRDEDGNESEEETQHCLGEGTEELTSVARWEGPIKYYYKGKHRTIHDAGGLCSPGRWPVEARKEMDSKEGMRAASSCKRMFLDWIQEQDKKSKEGVKEAFWALAGGKYKRSPFENEMPRYQEMLDRELEDIWRHGLPSEKESEFQKNQSHVAIGRRWGWWMARGGCRWGGQSACGRDHAQGPLSICEEKEKWNLSFTEEDFKDTFAENYKSAEENSADIERQVKEEVNLMMGLEEAKEKYQGRIVHDGSYSTGSRCWIG